MFLHDSFMTPFVEVSGKLIGNLPGQRHGIFVEMVLYLHGDLHGNVRQSPWDLMVTSMEIHSSLHGHVETAVTLAA